MTETALDSERLYLDYHDKLLSYIEYRIGHRQDAEDLCAAVFEKVLKKRGDYDPAKAAVSTWVFTIARNAVTDYFRTRHPAEVLPEELTAPDDPENRELRRETLRELAAALDALGQEARDIVILRYYRGLPLTEVARRMGLSYGMVKLRHRDALKFLEKRLKTPGV